MRVERRHRARRLGDKHHAVGDDRRRLDDPGAAHLIDGKLAGDGNAREFLWDDANCAIATINLRVDQIAGLGPKKTARRVRIAIQIAWLDGSTKTHGDKMLCQELLCLLVH